MGRGVRIGAAVAALAGAVAAAGVTCPAPGSGPCSYFRTAADGTVYGWSLEALCRANGDYTFVDGNKHSYAFNICANASTTCSPQWTAYTSHGAVIQSFGTTPSPCDYSCIDWDTGARVCCTASCEVIGRTGPVFGLQNASNPAKGGITLSYLGSPPTNEDPFQCPPGPINNLAQQASVTININCNASLNSSTLVVLRVEEPSTCNYTIVAESGAACGVPGGVPIAPDCPNKASALLQSCGGSVAQSWKFTGGAAQPGTLSVSLGGTQSTCLDMPSVGSSPLPLSPCSSSSSQWSRNSTSSAFVDAAFGSCLTSIGTSIASAPCDGSTAQSWAYDSTTGHLVSLSNGDCATVVVSMPVP